MAHLMISQRELGRPILGEIIRRHVEESMRLMREADEKLSTIARLSGFCNTAYFCKTFHEATGFTPHEWRRSLR